MHAFCGSTISSKFYDFKKNIASGQIKTTFPLASMYSLKH